MSTLRPLIAITQRVEHVPGREEVRDSLDRAWALFMDACGCALFPMPTETPRCADVLDAAGVGGIILSGGNSLVSTGAQDADATRDRLEAELIDYALERGLPLVGVCRGMQMLCHHLTGKPLVPVVGHAGSRHPLMCAPGAAEAGVCRSSVNSYHDFGVGAADIAPRLTVLAQSSDGIAEATVSACGRMMGIMWHPEREFPFNEADVALFRKMFTAGGR